jgi:two-component SAPR family response regulator
MVDIQLAALSIASSPTTARRRIQALLRRLRPGLHAAECTLLYYYSAAASLRAGSTAQAKAALGQALERAGSHGGQQALAGELVYDECTRQFVADAFSGHPIAGEVLRRIDLMDSTARKYQAVQAQRPESAELGLNALGTSEVWLHGQRVRSLEPLPRQILFFLADSRKIERDTILETFWPDVLAGRRVSSLYTAMHAIRRSLGSEVIVIDGSIYALNPAVDLHFDVEAFERAAGIALAMPAEDPRRLFSLTEAVHLYSGDFLPESSTNWAVERRRELEGLFLRLLTLHAQEAYARGQWNDAVGSYRQALTIDPLGDDLNLNYLELLGRLNRRSEAVGHYQRYTRLLSDELGVEPPPAIREAYARLIC